MEKENNNEKSVSDRERISHRNMLWLIYRALAEDIDISTLKNKSVYKRDTEENK